MVRIDSFVEEEFRQHRSGWEANVCAHNDREHTCMPFDRRAVWPTERPSRLPGASRGTLPLISEEEVSMHMLQSRAPSTNKKRGYTIKNYEELCTSMGVTDFPISGKSLVLYIVALTKKAVMYETVTDYLSIIKVESRRISNVCMSLMEDEMVRLALNAAKRLLGNRTKKRTVTLNAEQVRLLAHLTPESGRSRSTVAYLVGTMGLLRLKEVSSLKFTDISFSMNGDYVSLCIRQSKTDQSGVGATVYIGCISMPDCRECDKHECAMHRLYGMLFTLKESERSGSLFGVSYSQLSKDIKYLVTTVFTGVLEEDEEVGKKTAHSMRRTGVRLLAEANVRLEAIADYGRWKDVRTVQNNYMRDHSGRLGREKEYSQKMLS